MFGKSRSDGGVSKTKEERAEETMRYCETDGKSIVRFDRDSGLLSVVVPEFATGIGDFAFCGCSGLASVDLPRGIKDIGKSAFLGCSNLKEIYIPDSVERIGEGAFDGCGGLECIKTDENGRYRADGNCLTDVERSAVIRGSANGKIPDDGSVTAIERRAFDCCKNLKEIAIPDGITYIGGCAFDGCVGLTSVFIPASVKRIGVRVFGGCRKLTINFGGSVEQWKEIAKQELAGYKWNSGINGYIVVCVDGETM